MKPHIKTIHDRLKAGERIVVSYETLTELNDNDIASCFNAKQIGTRDCYVAWIGWQNQPTDLVFLENGTARGSV